MKKTGRSLSIPQLVRAVRGGSDKVAAQFAALGFRQGVELFHASAKVGHSLKHPEAHGDEHEICWVRKGRVHIAFSHEEHTLNPGEAIKFDAVLPHIYEIIEDAELIIAHLTKTHRF